MAHQPDENALIQLDGPTIAARAEFFPAEMRDGFIWLANYFRDECHRSTDSLVAKCLPLKITFDKTNWSKVLRGRWNRDAAGDPLDSPVIAQAKLVAAIEALRKAARRKEQGGGIGFIHTSTSKRIIDYLTKKWAPDRMNKLGVVIGETGLQKTATFRWFQREHNHGATGWFEAPEKPSLYRFKTALAGVWGCHPTCNTVKKEHVIDENCSDRNLIICDNMQRLYDDEAEGEQEVFSYVQRLVETKGCTFIMSFTPIFEARFRSAREQGFLEQFEGRAGGQKRFCRLAPQVPEEDVLTITKAYGLQDAGKHNDWCVELTRRPGRIRILFEILQTAKIRSEFLKQTLTIGHLQYADEDEGSAK